MQISKLSGKLYANGSPVSNITAYVSGTKVAVNADGYALDFEANEGVVLGGRGHFGNAQELVDEINKYLHSFSVDNMF